MPRIAKADLDVSDPQQTASKGLGLQCRCPVLGRVMANKALDVLAVDDPVAIAVVRIGLAVGDEGIQEGGGHRLGPRIRRVDTTAEGGADESEGQRGGDREGQRYPQPAKAAEADRGLSSLPGKRGFGGGVLKDAGRPGFAQLIQEDVNRVAAHAEFSLSTTN